jgi:hypothetical protein
MGESDVADPHPDQAFYFDADPHSNFHMAADPDPTFYFDAGPDPAIYTLIQTQNGFLKLRSSTGSGT